MTIFQFFSYLQKYSVDIILLSAATCGLTTLVKKFFLKGDKKKYATIVPFIIGTVLCAVYGYFTYGGGDFWNQCIQSGIQTGGLATVFYVFYEKFIRGDKTSADIETLTAKQILKDFVSEDKLDEISSLSAQAIKDETASDEEKQAKVSNILSENTAASEIEIAIFTKILISSVQTIKN